MAGPSKGIRLSFLAQADQGKYEMIFSQVANGIDILTATAAKEVLSRSNIGDEHLARIWDLSNVTNQPQLTFPEFATAMYLTSMKMTGAEIPHALPDSIRNELINAVRLVQSGTNAQSLVPMGQQQQQQQQQQSSYLPSTGNFSAAPSSLPTQPTGISYASSSFSHGSSISMQPTGVSTLSSSTSISGLPTAATPSGMLGNNLNFASRMMPHDSNYSIPSSSLSTNYTSNNFEALSKNVKIPWAVTADEKKQYKKIFNAWDTENKGYITGDKAKEIFSQSGLAQNVLMQIWALADPNNAGKLNLDEFSVAMHLIYRKLNGYDVPRHLPPELIPPSTRELADSVSQLKQSILNDIAKKKNMANFSSTPSVSSDSLKGSSMHRGLSTYGSSSSLLSTASALSSSSSRAITKKKSEEEDDDQHVGYVSSARRMGPDRTRIRDADVNLIKSSSSTGSPASSYGYRGKQTRIYDLRKEIDEKKKRIRELEEEAQPRRHTTPYEQLSALDKKEIDALKERIRELQKEISKNGVDDGHGHDVWTTYIDKTSELSNLAKQERLLEDEIRYMVDHTLRGLLAQVDETENDLMDRKIKAAEAKHRSSSSIASNNASFDISQHIVGTGPNGEVTESDRIKAKAKAMVAARMGKLTGKASPGTPTQSSSANDLEAEINKYKSEREEFKVYAESIDDSLKEIEDALQAIHLEITMIGLDIRKEGQDQKKIEERGRFEHGENVANDLKEFIQQLKYDAALAKQPDVDPSFESRFPSFT